MNDLTEKTKSVHSSCVFPQGRFRKVDIPSRQILLVKMGKGKCLCSSYYAVLSIFLITNKHTPGHAKTALQI